jgi:hypothetical protein
VVASFEVVAGDLLDLGQARARELTQRSQKAGHAIVGNPVDHSFALPTAVDQPGPAQNLKLGRGVREVHAAGGGEFVDAAVGLGEQLQQFDPLGVGDRRAEPAELGVEGVLCFSAGHANILASV